MKPFMGRRWEARRRTDLKTAEDRHMRKSKEEHHRDRNMPKSKEQHRRDRALITPRITAKAMGLHRVSTQIQIRARGPTKCLASDRGDSGLTATQA